MTNNSFRRWLSGRYAVSWQLALSLIANYFLTGFFFGETETSRSGITNHEIDLITGAAAGAIVFIASLLRVNIKINLFWFAQIVFLLSTVFALSLTIAVRSQGGFVIDAPDLVFSGFLQMFAVHNVMAIIISSLMETRSERMGLSIQRSKLAETKLSFENQIAEIQLRLTDIVEQKLSPLLNSLSDSIQIQTSASADVLAHQISEVLSEGVRPLSWEIERSEIENNRDSNLIIKRVGLLERLNFKISFEQFVAIKFLCAIYIFFEIPVMYFYFDAITAVQTSFVIVFTALMLWGLKSLTKRTYLRSWIAVGLFTMLVAATSFTFIGYRQLTHQLVAGVPEFALVLSMFQIAFLSAIFQASIVRRLAYIGAQREVNLELERLVSQVRQKAWVAKKSLARLVHGQVQSELFAAYLQLSRSEQADAAIYEQVGARIEKAKQALLEPEAKTQNFEVSVAQIVATWGSTFLVNPDISEEALQALNGDSVASACALEVILEGVNNAAKYGSGGRADLAIYLTKDSNLHIDVTNDADAFDTSPAGYGSTVLDEVTHEWVFEINDGVARLTALIMLSNPAV